MLRQKRVTVLMCVVLAATGIGLLVYRHRLDSTKGGADGSPLDEEKELATRPPLPKEWEGRWQRDLFAGTQSVEVRHATLGGPGAVYQVRDPQAVAALIQKLKLIAIHNDIALGSIPTAYLAFQKKDGSLMMGVESGNRLSAPQGIVFVRSDFFAALNQQIAAQEKHEVDVHQFLPSPPSPPPEPRVPPSARSLTSGFTSLTVQYTVGKRLHQKKITDEKTLAELHKILTVVNQESAEGQKPQSRVLIIGSKDKSTLYGQILSGTEFCDFQAGKFTVRPSFMHALNKHVSKLEGRDIILAGDNALLDSQIKGEQEIRNLLADVKAIHFPSPKNGDMVTVNKPEEVAQLVKTLAWIEVPARTIKLEKGELALELTTKDDRNVPLRYLKMGNGNELPGAAVLGGDLIDFPGFGPVWIDDQWKHRLPQIVMDRELEAKNRRAMQTTSLVCLDMPAFLKQVLNVVAHYRQGENELTGCLSAAESRPILEAIASGHVEALDWSGPRWEKEVKDLFERGAGSLDLTPGLGFYLMAVISGETECLIPDYGKLTFARSPIPAFQKAIAEKGDNPEKIQFVPR